MVGADLLGHVDEQAPRVDLSALNQSAVRDDLLAQLLQIEIVQDYLRAIVLYLHLNGHEILIFTNTNTNTII